MAEETHEEYQTIIIKGKGKRTKRQRQISPSPLPALQMFSATSSSTADYSAGGFVYDRFTVASSPTTSVGVTESSTDEEDQDMANCLILLAQGREGVGVAVGRGGGGGGGGGIINSSPCPIVPAAKLAPESLYLYQCKTCDRCFPSFQALGGHRASHKKPKNNNHLNFSEENDQFRNSNTILSLQISSSRPPQPVASFIAGIGNNVMIKPKVHECSICGAEFSSGQALGGHMRRHRALTTSATVKTTTSNKNNNTPQLQELIIKKERNMLELDLNLPAPADDDRNRTVTVFSASPLVDCHY